MPEITEETKKMVMQFQTYQQQLQSIIIQKETLKMQQLEAESAIKELDSSKQKDAFKITGQIMIRKPIEEIKQELAENKEDIDVRMASLEKTEERLNAKLVELQEKLKQVLK
jgi:prefoldin beta subunit